MLKNIPGCLSSDLFAAMMEMGHLDEIVLADSNFPGFSHAQRIIHCEGFSIPRLLNEMLTFLPLDDLSSSCAYVMKVSRKGVGTPPIWSEYEKIIEAKEQKAHCIDQLDRFDFYARAHKAYAVVLTDEKAIFANIILTKGIVKRIEP